MNAIKPESNPKCVYCGGEVLAKDLSCAIWPKMSASGELELISGAACGKCQRAQLTRNLDSHAGNERRGWLRHVNLPEYPE